MGLAIHLDTQHEGGEGQILNRQWPERERVLAMVSAEIRDLNIDHVMCLVNKPKRNQL